MAELTPTPTTPSERALFAALAIRSSTRSDGSVLLSSCLPAGEPARTLIEAFRSRARSHPDRVLIAERSGAGWRSVSWEEARQTSESLGQAMLDRGLDRDHPLMILAENGVDHLLLTLAAMTVGVAVMPVSAAYSQGRSFTRVRALVERYHPGAVFASDAERYGAALQALEPLGGVQVLGDGATGSQEPLASWAQTTPTDELAAAMRRVSPDTTAKILFTSGSTGEPKGVINTHRMLCANQAAIGQVWPFLREEPPVLVDWLPWSHTFGGNHNLNMVLVHGGTLYVDPGRPQPGAFTKTVEVLLEIAPTVYFNVPAGWALLASALEDHADLRERFFSRLRFMFTAAAALPEAIHERLRSLAGDEIPLTASWGCTESSPAATSAHFRHATAGNVGVPLPGVEVKLVPDGEKLEVRLRGESITPGYLDDEAATRSAFDDEGFYRTGDAMKMVDERNPAAGLLFDGRIAEDFKLTSGTWVRVGQLRTGLISECEILRDAVICGADRDHVAALVWLDDAQVARRLPGASAEDVRRHLQHALARLNTTGGSSRTVAGLLILDEPPQITAGEITDKGYINQRAVLRRRADQVQALYRPDPEVILPAADLEPTRST